MGTDDALMAAAAGGDDRAFEALVLRHQAFCWRVAYGYLGDIEEAHDIVQTAFMRIYDARARYQGQGRFLGWLKTTVVRLCLDFRSRKAPELRTDAGDVPALLSSLSSQVHRRLVNRELREALETLSEKSRLAVVLKYFGALSYQEIGELLELSPKAVESLLARARAELSRKLDPP